MKKQTKIAIDLQKQKAEKLLKMKSGNSDLQPSEVDTQKLIHELKTNHNDLKTQNEKLKAENLQLKLEVKEYTKLKLKEQALIVYERKYFNLFESMKDAFVSVDMSGRIVEFNQVYLDMLGYKENEIKKMTHSDITPVKWHRLEAKIVQEEILSKGFSGPYKKEYRKKDGTIFPVELRTFLINNDDGNPSSLWTIVHDISEHKQIEESLRESEERNKALVDANPDIMFVFDEKGSFVDYHNSYGKPLYSSPDSFIGKNISEVMPPEIANQFINQLTQVSQTGQIQIFNYQLNENNELREYESRLGKSGKSKFLAIIRDITEYKRVEETLLKNNSRLELAMQVANMAWWEINIKTGNITFNNRKAEMLGYPPEKFNHYNDFMELVHPDDYDNTMNAMHNYLNGNSNKYEAMYRMQTRSGFYKWFLDIGSIVEKDSNGAPRIVTGIVIDVNNRKLTEDALHESLEFNAQIIKGAQEGIVVMDRNLIYQVWNPYMEKLTGVSSSEVIGKKPLDIFPFLKEVGVMNNFEKALKGESIKSIDFNFNISLKGKSRWASDISSPLYNSKNEIIGVISTVRDITERKKTEQEIYQSLKLFYSIFNSSPNAIVLSKLSDGRYVQVNNRFLELTGYSQNEIIGYTSQELGLVKNPELHNKRLSIIQHGKRLTHEEVDIFTKSGETRHCLVYSERVTVENDKYILTNYHDFTERKKIEAENKMIKESLQNLNKHLVEIRENERASIARDIHDQLGQSLTALKIDLSWLYSKNDSNSELSHKLKGMIDLTSETIKDVQRISSDLRPSILDDIGLSAAIEWYCIEFAKRTGLHLQIDVNEVQSENMQLNLTVYRILQESLTNIIRHSQAKNVMINLSVAEKNLVLLIQDDGIGIPKDKVNSLKSFGIRGMIERVNQSGGFIEITSLSNGGTFVSLKIPLK